MVKYKELVRGLACLLAVFTMLASSALAAGIRVVPSVDRVEPGDTFAVDIVAEGIPAEGLGSVQFKLHVSAGEESDVVGVTDLDVSDAEAVNVATPLLMSNPTSTRSGLGPMFLNGQGTSGILVLDNETLSSGSALYTFGHSKGATRSVSNGSVARFMVKVGSRSAAEQIDFSLSDVLLLDGGPEYPLDYNLGATVSLSCNAQVPDLQGLSQADAAAALQTVGLSLGATYEIDNSAGNFPLGVVIEQSVAAGEQVLCESAVDVAINHAPTDVGGLTVSDKAADDTGSVVLTWTPSTSSDVAGYRVYVDGELKREVPNPQGAGAEVNGLANGEAHVLMVTSFDAFGNESSGVSATVTPQDDVLPVITPPSVSDGGFYKEPLSFEIVAEDTHLSSLTATLNGDSYASGSLIDVDDSYTLLIVAEDTSGNRSEYQVSFTLDQTVPQIDVANLEDGTHYNAALIPQINVVDVNLDEAALSYRLNGDVYVLGTPIGTEGDYLLEVDARDLAGNISSLDLNFTVDLTAPSLTISGVEDGAYYADDVTPVVAIEDLHLKNSSITLNGQPFDLGTVLTDEGDYLLEVTAEDRAGNVTTQALSFVIDKSAPLIDVTGVQDGAFYNSDVAVVIAISDNNLATESIVLNDEAFTSGSVLTAEGEYLLSVNATDKAGNTSNFNIHFIIDTTAPQLEVAGIADGAFYNAGVTPTVAVTDNYLKQQSITLNGEAYVPETPITDEGEYLLAVSAEDEAGNTSERQIHFVIDLTAPSIVTTGVQDGRHYNVDVIPEVTISDTYLESSSQRFNGAPFVSGTILTEEGEYLLELSAQDKAGNTSVETIAFVIDKTAPQLIVSGVEDGAFYNADVTPVLQIVELYLASSTLTLNETGFTSGDTITAEGSYTLTGEALDQAGNQSEFTYSFVIDKTSPTSTSSVGTPQYVTVEDLFVAAETEFSLFTEDGGVVPSGVTELVYAIGVQEFSAYEGSFTLSELDEGAHTLSYYATDLAGNSEDTQSFNVVLDKSAPQTAISYAGPSYITTDVQLFVTAETSFELAASDNLSGVASTRYSLDDGQPVVYERFTLTGLIDGNHVIRYASVDNLGHQEGAQQLDVVVDNTAPVTTLTLGTPIHEQGDVVYVAAETPVTLNSVDSGVGVASTEYRIDDGDWLTYSGVFTLAGLSDGVHEINYRAEDHLANQNLVQSVTVVLDGSAPQTSIQVGEPHYESERLYVTGETVFTLVATDANAGVAEILVRIDEGTWQTYAPFMLAGLADGDHLIEYYSVDQLGHVETTHALAVVVDNTPPETAIRFENQSYINGEQLLVSHRSEMVLSASDNLSGVAETLYRVDDQSVWSNYYEAVSLSGLEYGEHTVEYRSVDHVNNAETTRSVAFTLVGIDVKTEVLNVPRVLVWSEDPADMRGKAAVSYTASDIENMLGTAFGTSDAYYSWVSDKDQFQSELRSGIYNVAFIVNQDVPFDANFLREIRASVAGGMGLLVSSWGNNVHPILQDIFGIDFTGSMPMNEQQRPVVLYPGLTDGGLFTAEGRVLKTRLDGGTLAGVIPADTVCSGVRSLSFHYPVTPAVGDTIQVDVATRKGKKLTLIDSEKVTITALPNNGANTTVALSDIELLGVDEQGVSFRLSSISGYLGSDYVVTLTLTDDQGQIVSTEEVDIQPTCAANLQAGLMLGAFELTAVDVDQVKSGEDVPAVVLSSYGKGHAAFVAYNLIESAIMQPEGHLELLGALGPNLLNLEPTVTGGDIALLSTEISAYGASLDIVARELLDPELTYVPLFSENHSALEFHLQLGSEETSSYRYFVRLPLEQGVYEKRTDVSLDLNCLEVPFDSYAYDIHVPEDLDSLMTKAQSWVAEAKLQPGAPVELADTEQGLQELQSLPLVDEATIEPAIRLTVQLIDQVRGLEMDTDILLEALGQYLTVLQRKVSGLN